MSDTSNERYSFNAYSYKHCNIITSDVTGNSIGDYTVLTLIEKHSAYYISRARLTRKNTSVNKKILSLIQDWFS